MLLDNFDKEARGVAQVACNGSSGITLYLTTRPTETTYYTVTPGGWYIDVGFGDTAEAFSDYKLADSNAMDNNSLLTYVSSVITNTQPYIKCITSTYINNSGNDVIVKEMGIVNKQHGAATASGANYNCLITRKVLDNPITIHDGETYAFTYSISI